MMKLIFRFMEQSAISCRKKCGNLKWGRHRGIKRDVEGEEIDIAERFIHNNRSYFCGDFRCVFKEHIVLWRVEICFFITEGNRDGKR